METGRGRDIHIHETESEVDVEEATSTGSANYLCVSWDIKTWSIRMEKCLLAPGPFNKLSRREKLGSCGTTSFILADNLKAGAGQILSQQGEQPVLLMCSGPV